jgi:tetratricopeptide (TPR) repeat protein
MNKNKSIFVSSTFRDMQSERDALRDYVLPRVNEFAESYHRAVELIDLRWGVDTSCVSEAEQNQKVLRTCLDEIERCRPFFIGLIGDRYGWIPPVSEMELAVRDSQVCLTNLDMSVTALEIEYGVLRSPTPPICLFYFRVSPDYEKLSTDLCSVYRDNEDSLCRITQLKSEILEKYPDDTQSYIPIVTDEGLNVAPGWAEMVANDIIGKLYLEWGEVPTAERSWDDWESETQYDYRITKIEFFAGRDEFLRELFDFALSVNKSNLLLLQGEAGCGKSSLMCKLMEMLENKCLLVPFCCGISSGSSMAEHILWFAIPILCRYLNIEDKSGDFTKFSETKDYFTELLFLASKKTNIVMIVDALDQLISTDETQKMLWVRGDLPENFNLICSIIDGDEIDTILGLGGEVWQIPDISIDDERAIIHSIATKNRKQLNPAVVEYILEKQTDSGTRAALNPLYLNLITTDLVMMDRYDLGTVQTYMETGMSQPAALAKYMKQRIDETPGDPEGAYLSIIERLESLIGDGFVYIVCSILSVSRNGFRESDIEGIFRTLNKPYNPTDFAWLRQLLRGHFVQGNHLQWDFSHQCLRRAFQRTFPENLNQINNSIVNFMLDLAKIDEFLADQILHHLAIADVPDIAVRVILELYEEYEFKLPKSLAKVYYDVENGADFIHRLMDVPDDVDTSELWKLAYLIFDCSMRMPVKSIEYKKSLFEKLDSILIPTSNELSLTVKGLGEMNLAYLYEESGDQETANKYFEKSLKSYEDRYRKYGTSEEIVLTYIMYAGNLLSQGKTKSSSEYYQKALEIAQEQYKLDTSIKFRTYLCDAYNANGRFVSNTGSKEEATHFYWKALELAKQNVAENDGLNEKQTLRECYSNLGSNLVYLDQMQEAKDCLKLAFELAFQIYDQSGELSDQNNLGICAKDMGDFHLQLNEAGEYNQIYSYEEIFNFYKYYLEIETEIHESSGTISSMEGLSGAYQSMAEFYCYTDDYNSATEYFLKCRELKDQIYQQIKSIDTLQSLISLNNAIAQNYVMSDQEPEAIEHLLKNVDLMKKISKKNTTYLLLFSISITYKKLGKLYYFDDKEELAVKYYELAIAGLEKAYKKDKEIDTLDMLAECYRYAAHCCDFLDLDDDALSLHDKAIDSYCQIYNEKLTNETLSDYGQALFMAGEFNARLDYIEAATIYCEESISCYREIHEDLQTDESLEKFRDKCREIGDAFASADESELAEKYYKLANRRISE